MKTLLRLSKLIFLSNCKPQVVSTTEDLQFVRESEHVQKVFSMKTQVKQVGAISPACLNLPLFPVMLLAVLFGTIGHFL
ncbi:MAG: hypothetical protein MJ174_03250 [Treponema sp.]|nr:hypothetical protein [Treponema sp.]